MHKILLIIQREYFTRVKKRSFLLTTFLVPLFFIGMYAGIFFLTKKSFEDNHAFVYIVDQEGSIAPLLENSKNINYSTSNKDLQTQISLLKDEEDNTNILIIPKDFYSSQKIELLSSGKPNVSTQGDIKRSLSDILLNRQYKKMGVNIDSIKNI